MLSFRRTGAPALVATLALTLGTVAATGIGSGVIVGSGGDAAPTVVTAAAPPTTTVPAGTLSLTTTGGATNGVTKVDRLDASGAPVGDSQALASGSNCLLTSTGPSLLKISGLVPAFGAANRAGMKSGRIGVVETSLTPWCYRVDKASFLGQTETLVLGLGDTLVDGFGPLMAKSASLNIELASKTSKVTAIATGPGFSQEMNFSTCTPTVTANDGNCSWVITPNQPFNTLTLKPTSGSFSLDASAGNVTTFSLVGTAEQVLSCGNTITDDTTTSTQVKATYLGAAGPTECTGSVGVTLTSGPNIAELLKPNGQVPDAEFVFDFVWKSAANTADPNAALVPRTKADFDGDADGSNPPTPLSWCPHLVDKTVGSAHYLVVDAVKTAEWATDQAPGYPATGPGDTRQFACIVSQAPSLNSANDELTVTEKIYVFGDIKLLR